MKANELRIGNFIYNGLSKIITVTNIDSDGVNGFHDESVGGINYEYGGRIESIYRITLTEEWLLKFGFGDITEQCASKSINIKTFCKSFTVKGCNEQQTIFIELGTRGWTFKRVGYPLYNYVHQLQNLYFALTGEELIIKNK